jgi:hypothetical protein
VKLRIIISQPESLIDSESASCLALAKLMSVGNHVITAEPLEVLLCRKFGVIQQADWPLAALSLLGEKGEPGTGYWLRADPVHLALQRDSFSLSYPVPLRLLLQDVHDLIHTLNQHFSADGLRFHATESGVWSLRLDTPPEISTTLPVTAAGRDINFCLPQGAGATKWSRLLNEIQMLLHDHPVNQARETTGELAVNSIWLSGGGMLPKKLEAGADVLFANHLLARGLAAAADVPCLDLPENADTVFARSPMDGVVWVVLDSPEDAETRWFAPTLAALRAGKIKQLTIDFAVRDHVLSVDVRPKDLWKFWRRPKPLTSFFVAKS